MECTNPAGHLLLGCPNFRPRLIKWKVLSHVRNFICDDNGQDLIEYALLLAFVCVPLAQQELLAPHLVFPWQ